MEFACRIAFRKKIDTLCKEKECELVGERKIPIIFEKPYSLKRKIPAAKSHILKRSRSAYEKCERARIKNIFLCMLVMLNILDSTSCNEDEL